jgi:hypothetical protein
LSCGKGRYSEDYMVRADVYARKIHQMDVKKLKASEKIV